jgi:hypothetical protein
MAVLCGRDALGGQLSFDEFPKFIEKSYRERKYLS